MLNVLWITFSAYCTLCIVPTKIVMHYVYDAKNTSSINPEIKQNEQYFDC